MHGTAFSSQHAETTTRRSLGSLTEFLSALVNMLAELVASPPKPEPIVDDDVHIVRGRSRRRQ